MKQKFTAKQLAQWAVVLLCVLTLKLCYSKASADQLRWILAPTTALVELVSGTAFEYEARAGYLSREHSFLIAPSCAGVNFLLMAFLMLTARRFLRNRPQDCRWSFIPLAAVIAYLVTLVANTARIAIALQLRQLPDNAYLDDSQLHRIEGIVVYCGFLLLLFVASEKAASAETASLWRQARFPLLVYYAVTLGVPLINGGYRRGGDFWEHAAYVLLIPLLLILPLAAFRRPWKRAKPREGEPACSP
jgi:exosortase K